MKKALSFLFTFVLIFVYSSCKKEYVTDCFKGTGEEATETRNLIGFNKISVYNNLNLVLIQDTAKDGLILLKGGKNLLPSIKAYIKDSTLILEDNNHCNFSRSFKNKLTVEVHFAALKKLIVNDNAYVSNTKKIYFDELDIRHLGMGEVNMNLHCGFLRTWQGNAGGITLEGWSAVYVCSIEDVGPVDASKMQGDYTYVFHWGTNDVHVKPYKEFGAMLYGRGNIYYNQEPLKKDIQVKGGSGRFIKE
ncbi:MAG: DUF2807 domain-containing protein [Bacteroidetes bacterium]|nr:DUF2807 domain-containing protein [Bacteroidota bacterium]